MEYYELHPENPQPRYINKAVDTLKRGGIIIYPTYSETVGYRIDGPRKSAVFIPDIDKWERWPPETRSVVRSKDSTSIFRQNR